MDWSVTRLARLLLAGTALVFSLLLAELILRLPTSSEVSHREHAAPFTGSDYLPFTLPRSMNYRHKTEEFDVFYRTNHLGYRGTYPTQIVCPPKRKRILICGDSFTFGWGNDHADTFVGAMQRSLGTGFEAINAGYHAGYSPDSYYAYLMREGLELGPEVVVLVLYTANDVSDIADNLWYELDTLGAPRRVEACRDPPYLSRLPGQVNSTVGSKQAQTMVSKGSRAEKEPPVQADRSLLDPGIE